MKRIYWQVCAGSLMLILAPPRAAIPRLQHPRRLKAQRPPVQYKTQRPGASAQRSLSSPRTHLTWPFCSRPRLSR